MCGALFPCCLHVLMMLHISTWIGFVSLNQGVKCSLYGCTRISVYNSVRDVCGAGNPQYK